jgi:hypothetical protein
MSDTNILPNAYRGVSVTRVAVGRDLRHTFLGRVAYRRTRFLVVRDDSGATTLLRVEKESSAPLFSPITEVEILAEPDECAFVVDPDADTAVPSELARVAAERASHARAVVVKGRYEHISFIMNPRPLVVAVQEVVPPEPAKLLDQVRRLLAVAEDLPPMLAVPDTTSFDELAARAPAEHYLLPCAGSGVAVGAATSYLDGRPRREPWTLLGCARSRDIHEWFYGDRPPQVDMCPRQRPSGAHEAVITKCCLLEDHIEHDGGRVVVPWGASLRQVGDALREVARWWEPAWQPV